MIRKLYIAEKPDIGRAIADYLGGTWDKSARSCYRQGDIVVSWAYGHILTQFEPEDYSEKYRSWSLDNYPIVPEIWKNKPSAAAKKQLEVLKVLLKDAQEVIHAGDPDREGQLLIQEILDYFNYKGKVSRLLINAKDEKSMKRAFDSIDSNDNYQGMYYSALGRQRSDWLIGMNLTRLYTNVARKIGMNLTMPIGRVKTPTLALVVQREKEINEFKETIYYELSIDVQLNNATIHAIHETDSYITDKNQADQLKKDIENEGKAEVLSCESKNKKEAAPLPYSLDTLQADAGRKFGWSPQKTLDLTQKLYEAKFVSYPRSDCNFLPEGQYNDATDILKNLQKYSNDQVFNKVDTSIHSRCWNDKKITAHHAIIPTGVIPKELSKEENQLYQMIAIRYALQFFPTHEYIETSYSFKVCDEIFSGKSKFVTQAGWRDIEKQENEKEATTSGKISLNMGEKLPIFEIKDTEKTTKPPKRFTEATLLSAMANIYKFVDRENKELREQLKEIKGIGTPATRASIIDSLIHGRNPLLQLEKRNIIPTNEAKVMINILPDHLRKPDSTAAMELKLATIEKNARENELNQYLSNIVDLIKKLQEESKATKIVSPANIKTFECPICKEGRLIKRKGKFSTFWGCNRYQEGCKAMFDDEKGEPIIILCPACEKNFLRLKNGKYGTFWSCNGYQEGCKFTCPNKKGMPDLKAAKKES